jgi:hypothetical protein
MIPVHLKTSDLKDVGDETYYLVAANGVFLVKTAALFSAGLQEQAPSLALSIPKVPRGLLEPIYGFFQLVYDRFDGEAVVFLYYSPERCEFQAEAPPQRLTRIRTSRGWRTASRVEYRSIPRPDGFLKLGDAHSHGDSPAFFSSTDDRDDVEDGLRVVMGRLDRPRPDVGVSFVANGTRFRVEVEDVLEEFADHTRPPEAWTRRITCRFEDRDRVWQSGIEHGER